MAGRADSRDVLGPAVMVGIGVAGTLDQVLLHQLLHWHHFYARSTTATGLVTDGVFHIFSTVMLAWGGWLLLHGRTGLQGHTRRSWAGVLVGAGGFNLYDGTLQHKVLELHQVREGVPDDLPYDVAFVGAAVAVLGVGLMMLRRLPGEGEGSGPG